jgi:hypothetical protein
MASRDTLAALVEREPLYVPGLYGLAHAWIFTALNDITNSDESWPKVDALARQALALDSSAASAWLALAAEDMFATGNLARARERIARARSLDSLDPDAPGMLSVWFRFHRSMDSAVAEARVAHRLDPLSQLFARLVGKNLFFDPAACRRHSANDRDAGPIDEEWKASASDGVCEGVRSPRRHPRDTSLARFHVAAPRQLPSPGPPGSALRLPARGRAISAVGSTVAASTSRRMNIVLTHEAFMLIPVVQAMLLRELAAVQRSVEAYPDDASLWALPEGLPNAGGTIVLHLAGNLQHFVGAVLGGNGYRRDREAEFARRDVPRAELVVELENTVNAVRQTLPTLREESLGQPYPVKVGGQVLSTGVVLVHLATHLAYHLGQLDYHRRVVTGDSTGVGAVSPVRIGGE